MADRTPFRFTHASLVALLSSAMAACGSTTTSPNPSKDAAVQDTAGDAARDAATDTQQDAPEDARDAQSECPPGAVPVDGGCVFSVRRPFLVGASMRTASGLVRDDWLPRRAPRPIEIDPKTARALAAIWLQDGLEEHASVAAFARFSLCLLSVGAPAEMVVVSQRASLDEVRHAQACFALARRYGSEAFGPTELSLQGALNPLSLAELAALTAEEGVVGETLGTVLAAAELDVSRDPDVLRVREKLLKDELRHAELAWRFVRWAVLRDPAAVVPAVADAAARAIRATLAMPLKQYDGIDLDTWHAHGRLTCHEARRAIVRGIEEVVEPCLRQLLAVPRGGRTVEGKGPELELAVQPPEV